MPDPKIVPWSDARRYLEDRPFIILGNGVSKTLAPNFDYKRLSDAMSDPMLAALFTEHETYNFERVLGELRSCARTLHVLRYDSRFVWSAYDQVRQALLDAVLSVHPHFSDIPITALQRYGTAIAHYRGVFTTNYDLTLPWALMQGVTGTVRDFFWGSIAAGEHAGLRCVFSEMDTGIVSDKVPVYYLHGALHLYEPVAGITAKRTADARDLLTQAFDKRTIPPLIITEGVSHSKVSRIAANNYLWFSYLALQAAQNDFVVFGHGLSEQDAHIVEALSFHHRRIAISIYAPDRRTAKHLTAYYQSRFPDHELIFFFSETHPLGQLQTTPDNVT
jgi:hypothetical protein